VVDLVTNLFFLIVGWLTFLVGIIALVYGMYGMRVPGFDKTVRNFSLILGVVLISVVLSFYFNPSNPTNKFCGRYVSVTNSKLTIQLLGDGTFKADPHFLVKTTGNWRLIHDDEVYLIEFLTKDNFRLKSFDIIEKNESIILTNKNDVNQVQDQFELIRK
jgi:hypothetical protein